MNNETKPHQSAQEQRPSPPASPTVDFQQVDLEEEDLPDLADVADLWNLPSANENRSTVPGTVFTIVGHTQESVDHFFSGPLMTMSNVLKGKCEMCVKITELRRNK